jgi:membrane protease YdiL (CAAX protease family)
MSIAFCILFALYQSAEGVGARLLHSEIVQDAFMVSAVVVAWPVGRWILGWRGYAAYALEWPPSAPLWLGAGVVLSLLGKAAAIAIGLRIGAYIRTAEPVRELSIATIGLMLVATFVASIAEDIITRGFWWRVQPVAATTGRFVMASALIYLLNHVFRLSKGPAEWFMLVCLGVAYATALVRTGSLWAAVGLHWGWNLANGLADGLISVDANPALTPYLSGAINLAMTAVVLALPIWRRPQAVAADKVR